MHDRITNIEIKIAHVEQSVSELSDVLYSQQQQLDRLVKNLDKLAETLTNGTDSLASPDNLTDKPPHY
jgi:SlyX protein